MDSLAGVAGGTRIELFPSAGTRYHAHVHRSDGVTVRLEGGSWNRIGGRPGRVPHDLAHLIVERELGLDRGLWGVLAAGGLVQNAAILAGRRPPHAERRGRELSAASGEQLRRAEVLVRAIADASAAGSHDIAALHHAVGDRWRHSALTRPAIERIDTQLREAARAWRAAAPGQALEFRWPG